MVLQSPVDNGDWYGQSKASTESLALGLKRAAQVDDFDNASRLLHGHPFDTTQAMNRRSSWHGVIV